ncbi:MAG: diacylglycerol kinase family lipid kinase [Bradymonadaceae bacterium]|nr:diacylglycerol kinase family lipid kinase [Lujinxingiaceae bacterium]
MSVNLRTFVIANPRAGAGTVKEEWTLIERLLRTKIPELDYAFTEGPAHATLLAREALRAGWEMVVSVGGDGTLNEVVNGFFEKPDANASYELDADGWIARKNAEPRPIHDKAVLGHVPLGTGGDFRRTIGLMGGLSETIEHLSGRHTRPIDVGQLAYLDHKDNLATRYFINIASAGFAGQVDHFTNGSWKGLGGTASFMAASVRTYAMWKNVDLEVRLDETEEIRDKMMNLVVANGEYFGGGMWVAPGAEIDDGEFQVVVMGDISKLESFEAIAGIYRGRHLSMRKVYRRRARQVAARAVDTKQPVLLDLDGEQPGRLPAMWNIHAGAIQLKI